MNLTQNHNFLNPAIKDFFAKNQDQIKRYFNVNDKSWIQEYLTKRYLPHDEPWLTLVALYSIFGDQAVIKYNTNGTNAFNDILHNAALFNSIIFKELHEIKVEVVLPEILEYRDLMQKTIKEGTIHFYPDIIEIIKKSKTGKNASLEGNTNLDVKITGLNTKGEDAVIFIEAKFLSDISKDIKYNPVRDQIARNMDAGIDYCKNNNINLSNFYFLLLTPSVFRPDDFGGHKPHSLDTFGIDKSRLYCYKMMEYRNPANLKKALPHRRDKELSVVCGNIGWITFEDFIKNAIDRNTISNPEVASMIKDFFQERNLLQKK